MKNLLMCDPSHYGVKYKINPWMENNIDKVNKDVATKQWNTLYNELCKHTTINVIDGHDNVPDLVFTANGGFVIDNIFLLSNFSKKERKLEEEYFKKYFDGKNFKVIQPKHFYEGEGDHLVDNNDRHFIGYGFRSSLDNLLDIPRIINKKVKFLNLVDPRWYHLDTCFCPLPNGEILWYPNAFSQHSQDTILNSFMHHVEVSLEDALAFSCNCVCIGKNIFIPKNKYVSIQLESLGYNVFEFEMSEFIKSGGAAKCCVLTIR